MQTDINLLFESVARSIAGSVSLPSTGVYDLQEGLMVTAATYDNPFQFGKFSPQSNAFGEDLGVGRMRLMMRMGVSGTLPFVGAGATLNVAYQGAVDNLGGTIAGLSWVTFAETGPVLTAANLTANARVVLPDISHRQFVSALGVQGGMPRFIRLLYQIVGTFTQGTITYAGMFMPASDIDIPYYGGGFTVAP